MTYGTASSGAVLVEAEVLNTIVSVVRNSHICTAVEHSVHQWLLICCTNGRGHATLPDGVYFDFDEGTVVVIPPNTHHAIESSEDYTDIRIYLDHPAILSRTAFAVADNPQKYLKATFEQAWLCMHSKAGNTEQLLDSLGATIINYIIVMNAEAAYSSPVKKIHDIILQNYTQCNFVLDEAIRQMPFHYDYLRKCFKKEVGLTPREYLTQLRMKKARAMLTASSFRDFNVNEVAHQCGYDDPLYFSRMFKKYHSVPPSCYAKQSQTKRCSNR